MTWKKKKILVTVKAYPEKSTKYKGHLVCTAGITDEEEWIRLYPITIQKFIGKHKVKKFYWIEAECKKATHEKLNRKESYKVREDSIRVIDTSLTEPEPDWYARHKILSNHISSSKEALEEAYKDDKTSLGIIKPKEVEFYHSNELKIYQNNHSYQQAIDGSRIPIFDPLPHIFRYKFKCSSDEEKLHDIQCEDWELMESYRSWGQRYNNTSVLWDKLYSKYHTQMIEKKDLHFIMGMYSQYPTWMIIGLYYPPKGTTNTTTLDRWM